MFELFIDDDVLQNIVNFSNTYAHQNNVQREIVDLFEIKRFIGILLLTGYHQLLNIRAYWSAQPDFGVSLVKQALTRTKFENIKRFLHLCNNKELDTNDRFAKIRQFLSELNRRFLQFGFFHTHLSIDERMIPYFGRHSYKMFIRGKPIRFGFKYWCLFSDDLYLYTAIPYSGASVEHDKQIGLLAQFTGAIA